MNKLILYILLFFCPALAIAQTGQDTITEVHAGVSAGAPVADTVVTETAAATAPPKPLEPPVYTQRKFKPGFKKEYTADDFVYVDEDQGEPSLWDRFVRWLGDILDSIFGGEKPSVTGSLLKLVLKIIAFAVIGLVVYFIVRAILNKEGLWIFGRSRRGIAIDDVEEANIHAMDFAKLIEETKTVGNYKLAVRYYYLWLLKKLSLREIIAWHWDKTNADYSYEIKNDGLKKDFDYLSYVYDHSWYGDFPIDEKAFVKAEKAFRKTLNTL